MKRLYRLAGMAAVVASLATTLFVSSATVATAVPVRVTQPFNVHIRTDITGCVDEPRNFGDERSTCTSRGYFDTGHTAGFDGTGGGVTYRPIPGGLTFVSLIADTGALVGGTIPSRGSGQFTITNFSAPGFGNLASFGQRLDLNVVRAPSGGGTPGGYYDFYLSGNLDVLVDVPDPCPPRPFPYPPLPPGPIGPCSTAPTFNPFGS